ncbi:NAD(P)-binding protein [Eremomyces bilateralis CBS 781.70]|uniref:NAD(P)-binding protein n=1 Tax=Eremomyces bilateralis CBS 781.70 TaxID=1392243 RepID=A0A6G1GD98_9PEZI|nr:NAD(P)-binding protein [Eremomyces bilateralis CBS 781.70]KAF1816075.1 NAD(P)-binding protein [Eremomyces bilateralis CBS 781.70]
MTQFGFHTTGQQVVEAFPEQAKGRTFAVTGASENGLGATTATSLAHGHPAAIFLLARSESKITPVIQKIHAIDPSIKAVFVNVDLTDLDSIRAAASAIQSQTSKLDVLINNAGAYSPWESYGQSKAANILFSLELAKRGAARGLLAFSVHPGSIYETNLVAHLTQEQVQNIGEMAKSYGFEIDPRKTKEEGCATSLVAALDPRVESQSGKYFVDCAVKQQKAWAADPEDAARLWTLSEELVGQKFEL